MLVTWTPNTSVVLWCLWLSHLNSDYQWGSLACINLFAVTEYDGSTDNMLHACFCPNSSCISGPCYFDERRQLMENDQQLKAEYFKTNYGESPEVSPKSIASKAPSPLLPAAEIKSTSRRQPSPLQDRLSQPSEIQRPRSALHAGDFTEEQEKLNEIAQNSPRPSTYFPTTFDGGPLGTSPTTPWYTPPASFQGFGATRRSSPQERPHEFVDRRPRRSRAPSLSSFSSSSYVLKAPTTPLVQQSNNTDLDFSPRDRSPSPDKSSRRHTLPPHTFRHMHTSPSGHLPTSTQPVRHTPSYRRDNSFPYSHHPRRSLTSNWSLQASTSPQAPPYLRSRRTSFSEASPLHHASMVGSYEESILRGWMSTAPSKPLNFTAQIGVLGKGNCKPKCPAHVTVPFPAVFYSWNAGNGRNVSNDDPSPYVGHIDLQHSLAPPETKESVTADREEIGVDLRIEDVGFESSTANVTPSSSKSKKRRRTLPSSAPPGGSYRIPEQGQLQIIIKNPNKTAVKLFLVPYDLTGMGSGTKTFVRQRSYSADAINDTPLTSKPLNDTAPLPKKPTLRYLIHLNICSPSKGRFYLYQNIRVVFANRVPDNKEQLRNEIQVPEPRFSAYKPNRDSLPGSNSSAVVKITAEKAYRRRSSGFAFGTDDLDDRAPHTFAGGSTFSFNSGQVVPPIPAVPFSLIVSRQRPKNENGRAEDDAMDIDTSRPATASDVQSPLSDKTNRFKGVQLSSSYRSNSSDGSDSYNKLSKGESGYGGIFGRPGTPEPGEGLLAMRLKSMGPQRVAKPAQEET